MAEVQLELGQEEKALQLYQKCLALLRGLSALDEPDKSELRILMDIARCQEALNDWAEATETYELLESRLLKELEQKPNPTAIRRLAWVKCQLGMFEEAAELSNQVDAPETNMDKARARLIAAFIAYISGNQAAAKDNILHVSANGMLTPNLKWELKYDIRYVIKYHVPEVNLEQFMALVATI